MKRNMKKIVFALCAMAMFWPVAVCQEKTYKVGDVFYEDGEAVGVVFAVEDGGRHGKVVRLWDFTSVGRCWGDSWGTGNVGYGWESYRLYRSQDNELLHQTVSEEAVHNANSGATDKNDGALNSRRIVWNWYYKRKDDGSLSTELYCPLLRDIMGICNPELFDSVTSQDESDAFNYYDPVREGHWYLPAVGELEELYGLCAQEGLNEAIEAAGGKALYGFYWSSTELVWDAGHATHAYTYNIIGGYSHYMYKYDGISNPPVYVRAVRRF